MSKPEKAEGLLAGKPTEAIRFIAGGKNPKEQKESASCMCSGIEGHKGRQQGICAVETSRPGCKVYDRGSTALADFKKRGA